MLQAATFSLSAIGVLTATLALCAALFAGWQRDLFRNNLVGLFVSVLLLLGLVVAFTEDSVNQAEGGLLRQSLTGVVYVLSFWFAIRTRDGNLSIPWHLMPIGLLLLLALAFASSLWSPEPAVTLRRAVQFAGVVIFAIAAVRNFESDPMWRQYVNALLPWLVVGLLIAPFAIEFAYDRGNFRGLSSHKNSWAGIALTATLILAIQLRKKPGSAYLWLAMLVSLVTIFLTRSATAISLAAAMLCFGLLYRASLSRDNTMRAALVVLAMVGAALPLLSVLLTGESPLATASGLYFEAVQKEATLTGRNVLWETVLENAWLSPWLGNGYGAFWIGNAGPSVSVVAGLPWSPVHSHNGYIDLFNELGLAGVTIFSFMILSHLVNIARIWRFNRDAATLHLIIVAAVLGYNLAETSVLNATHALWLLLVLSVVDAHRLAGHRPLS